MVLKSGDGQLGTCVPNQKSSPVCSIARELTSTVQAPVNSVMYQKGLSV